MNNLLSRIESLPFSEKDILTVADRKANLVLYPEIAKYRSISQLLGKHKACIILYITRSNADSIYGHWTCIFQVGPNLLEWFDPYAYSIDSEMSFCHPKYPLYLSDLILKSSFNIVENRYQLQNRNNSNMSTCGRHVAMRLQFRNLPIKSYAQLLSSVKGLSPDDVVTMLTAFIK